MTSIKAITTSKYTLYLMVCLFLLAGLFWFASIHYNDVQAKLGVGQIKFKQITSGADHTCAIASDDKAYCWGLGTNGQLGNGSTTTQTTPVAVSQGAMPANSTVQQIIAGDNHTCAIASDNKAYCWGSGASGQLGNNTTTATQSTPVAVSQGAMPGGWTISQISAGIAHTCAIASDNLAYCWGLGTNGRLGNSSTAQQNTPVAVSQGAMPGGWTISQISAGDTHTCAIASNNRAYCWGTGTNGRLGNGSTTTSNTTPVAVSQGAMPSTTVSQISSGGSHTCAIASNNLAYCWGAASVGRLGNGTTTPDRTTPVAVSQGAMPGGWTIQRISSGGSHTCAIASNNLAYCWGSGANGRLGNNSTSDQSTPVAVSQGAMPGGATISSIDSGSGGYTCAIASDSNSYCWGYGGNGQLGDGSTTGTQSTAVLVLFKNELTLRQISAGVSHTCAIASDGKAYCWGAGVNGQLGNGGTPTTQLTPVAVSQGAMPGGATFKQITVGNTHTCAIASDNEAYCWGSPSNGRLGNGVNTGSFTTPVAVNQGATPAGSTIRQISAGDSHTCAIASDNKAYCWGLVSSGQLGNGVTTGSYNSPTAVLQGATPLGSTFNQIDAGGTHTCAIASNNLPYCWGAAGNGRLGNGTTTPNQSTPVAVSQGAMPAGATVTQISADWQHTCAIASDNKAYCWGSGGLGRLGDGATGNQTSPVAVLQGAMPAGATIQQISAGAVHSCAIASDSKAYCWGYTFYGQLGNGSSGSVTGETSPVAVLQGAMPAGVIVQQISAGLYHACAIASDIKTYCWGYNGTGQVGDNSTTDRNIPVAAPVYRTVEMAQSVYRAYGASSTTSPGSPLAADNTSATLGSIASDFRIRIGLTNQESDQPLFQFTNIGGGTYHACAIASDNKAYCWGNGGNGRLGDAGFSNQTSPVAVSQGAMPAGSTIRQIAGGETHTCAIASDNKAYCWGNMINGRLGNGINTGNQSTPVAVSQGAMPAGATIRQITAGTNHTCAIASDNKAYCWGAGAHSQLGNNSTSDQSTPVAVSQGAMPAGTTLLQITAGEEHTCAIASDNKAYCWGSALNGRLGNGTTSNNQATPVAVLQGAMPAGSIVRQIDAGDYHTCAIASDNKPYCWGYGGAGRLGNGASSDQSTPVAVSQGAMPSGSIVQQITAGEEHGCVVASDVKPYCWGWSGDGQLGNGSSGTGSSTPVAVSQGAMPAGFTVQYIVAGGYYSCAIASNSKNYCWGAGNNGQMGNGSLTHPQTTAVAVSQGAIQTISSIITTESLSLSLQVAPLGGAGTCSAVTSGWGDVTTTSSMNWGTAPPSHSSVISTFGSDPSAPTGSGYAYQSVVQSGSFTNTRAIAPQQTGLWDFVLHDRSSTSATAYCFRVTSTTSGPSIDTYSQYPRITTATGSLDVLFVDNSGVPISSPATDTAFSAAPTSSSVQATNSTFTNNSTKQLQLHNSSSNSGWTVSLAATGGPTSAWQSGTDDYPYNASISANGQLTVNMVGANLTALGTDPTGSSCAFTGITYGFTAVSYSNVVSAITLASGSPSSQFNCTWRLRDVSMSQTIPAFQSAGSYTLDMTATIVAT